MEPRNYIIRDFTDGFKGYWIHEVPLSTTWPKGFYFDGRGPEFATKYASDEQARRVANRLEITEYVLEII